VLHGKVYDVTSYLEEHPGGINKIMEWAGGDATKAFDEVKHSITALQKKEQFVIGEVERKGNPLAIWLAVVAIALGIYILLKLF
jgi:cytochrome b involved in lipid metabolism